MNKTLAIVLFVAGIFFAIGYYLAHVPREMFSAQASVISVILISLPALYGFWKLYGKKALWSIIVVGIFAMIIETVGIYTGFPYSSFQYTLPIGAKLLGTTPWTVFIAWTPLVIGAFVLSYKVFNQKWSRYLSYLGILVATDMVLDPGAVARGLWTYDGGGFFYNVPLENFLGWIFSGSIAYLIIKLILRHKKANASSSQESIATASLLLSLGLWAGVNTAYEQYLPIGIAVILILLFTAILRVHQRKTTKELTSMQE